ncbi:SCP-like extracellular [Paenibacillus sp. FSL H8-0548]|uniref:CAP domain-containing protein n=1 Tax=Paenibacillus sp. FSL H8-0548 TaxID=1920422 RepID=UPI00096CD0DB|nr:CAP domain-containing protein [Paenibacillus sp. FSL H8-0548]OMF22734.1 SCP-like extracellular [Paenibacillus sp. FSL H8-0548]
MFRIIILAAILLITGCGANAKNDLPPNQVTPQQTQVEKFDTKAHTITRKTQASSIVTSKDGKSSISMKQVPNTSTTDWFDWFNRGQVSVENPANQAPAKTAPNETSKPSQTQFEQQVLDLVNQERSKVGLKSLVMNSELSNMAMVKAKDMHDNNYFDHNSPRYGSPFDMMKEFGIEYSSAGENIAKGQQSPTQVMNDWMNSPGHRANILKDSFTQIGIAYYNGEWVQEFIG